MSMYYDMKQVFVNANKNHGVSKEICAEMFIDTLGAVEWEVDELEIDYDDPKWEEKEKQLAIKELFGA